MSISKTSVLIGISMVHLPAFSLSLAEASNVEVMCGNLKDNIGIPCYENTETHGNRFNSEPERSTFTRKINRATKRW